MRQTEFFNRPPANRDRYPWTIIGYTLILGLSVEYIDSLTTDWLIIISTASLMAGVYDVAGRLHDSLLERIKHEVRKQGDV